jgi:hypothetical protein
VVFHPFEVSCLYQMVIFSWGGNWVYRVLNCFDHPKQNWNDVDLLLGRWMRLEQKRPWRQMRLLLIYADGLRGHRSWL